MNAIFSLNDFVLVDGDQLVTDSRKVAKHFEKQHAKVLRVFGNYSQRQATGAAPILASALKSMS
ncbi:hypothetical protein [Burkholderia glumae]|uniref:hypothetical protein n=1 Tax=Burkholderia glumae TaxID=337 RepID=UPI003B9A4653